MFSEDEIAAMSQDLRKAIGADLRTHLIAFATWLLEGEYGEGKEAEYVDKYLAEKKP